MKIRNGFISNSSSSSFVVLFPIEPKNAADVQDILFKDEKFYPLPESDDEEYRQDEEMNNNVSWPVETISQTVWSDICDQKKNDFGKAEEILNSGTIEDENAPDYSDFNHIKNWDKQWKAYRDAKNKYAKEKMKNFFNLRKLKLKKLNNETIENGVLYCFSYADEDGAYGSALEHGNLFNNLKHIRVSNH
jgi:hypothetical protein